MSAGLIKMCVTGPNKFSYFFLPDSVNAPQKSDIDLLLDSVIALQQSEGRFWHAVWESWEAPHGLRTFIHIEVKGSGYWATTSDSDGRKLSHHHLMQSHQSGIFFGRKTQEL